ncbi:uncharacterized protein VTP21DRAFT_2114 [Calcarisporiella thermophila]|uniref:uncharacterized protein n=1 Tax=Calcarisporiella thermophila TaxID=911321 RepID=UPI00374269E5
MSRDRFPTTPNLYELNPEVQDLLSIDEFKKKDFTTKEFIENLSSAILSGSDGEKRAFDPKPLIRTFEAAVNRLESLRVHVRDKCDEIEGSAQLAETSHKKRLGELNSLFQDVYRSFENLETRINEVGKTAIRIGEQLETLDKQRTRASEAREVLEYYTDFMRGGSKRLEQLRMGSGPDGQRKAAIIARRLNVISKDVGADGKTKSAIEKFCEVLEKDLLEDFDRAYRRGDAKIMAHCARTLQEFNGGRSCIQIYVNQHEFFMSNAVLYKANSDLPPKFVQGLESPSMELPPPDDGLVTLYDTVHRTICREADIIVAVFPRPAQVMSVFLQRIFAQPIQSYLESLLKHAESHSLLAYLRTLAAAHASTKALIQNLSSLDTLVKVTDITSTSAEVSSSGPRLGDGSSSAPLSTTLLRCKEDLFVPYTEGDNYLNKERGSLSGLFENLLAKFFSAQAQRKLKTKTGGMFARTFNQISSTASPNKSDTEMQSPVNGATNGSSISDEEEAGLPSTEIILHILNIHAEAVARSIELTSESDQPRVAGLLFKTLLEYAVTRYVEAALDGALDELAALDTKTEPEFRGMLVVNRTNDVLRLLQSHFKAAILPLVIASPITHREVVKDKNELMSKIEDKANQVVQKTIDAITAHLSFLLSKQKKNDFRPKDEDALIMSLATQPCTNCVEFLKKIHSNITQCLEGKNLEAFFLEVGISFHSILLEHLKKFYVSAAGGLILTKDIVKYQEVIHVFKLAQLNERFEMLRQLGNLFIVRPEILKSILSEGYLARIDQQLLYPYLEMRVDYKSAKIDHLIGIVNGNTSTSGATSDLDILGKRLSKLALEDGVKDALSKYSTKMTAYYSAFR